MAEYKRILKRDFDYSDEEIANIMGKVLQFTISVSPKEKINIITEDPDDDKIIECAIEAEADYIISYDKHLLKLGTCGRINIVRPEDMRSL